MESTATVETPRRAPISQQETDEPSWLWHGTVPSLNGLRAVSIFIVILSHVFIHAQIPESYLPLAGPTGVDVFFVISGFLITLLLLREQKRAGSISVPYFYVRRALRIFPAYFSYLGIMAGLAALGIIDLPTSALVAALTYTTNFFRLGTWDVGHTWSLCVEEHFYLLWPLILVLCGRDRAWKVATVYVLLTPLLRVILRLAFRDSLELGFFTLVRMDAIAVGCCLAFAATSARVRPRLELSPSQSRLVVTAGIVFLMLSNWLTVNYSLRLEPVGYYAAFLAGTVNAVAIAAIVWVCVTHPKGILGKFLNSRLLSFVGVSSPTEACTSGAAAFF